MKKPLILTSILALALAACSGGGGEHNPGHTHGPAGTPTGPAAPVTPSTGVQIQSFTAGQGAVNASNANLTNMASYTTNYSGGTSIQNEITTYVNALITRGGMFNLNSRAASNRAASNRATRDADFAAADAAITSMKQVMYDMAHLSGDDLTAYVTNNKADVMTAFILWNNDPDAVSAETTVDELITAFNGYGLDAENVMGALNNFDENNFHFTKADMSTVKLRDTGQDAYFKFDLDDGGAITTVSLWVNPTSEYGTSWTADGTHGHDVKIVINNSGEAEAITDDGLNPFGADYLIEDTGKLARNGSGTGFANSINSYEFTLGEHTLGDTVIDSDEFKKVEINSQDELTAETAKQKLKDYIIAKVNKKMHNQNGINPEPDGAVDEFVAVANWYIDRIDDIVDSAFVSGSYQGAISQSATMNGVGKDVGLQYADFGYSEMTRTMGNESETQYLTYVGGYDARRMDNNPANNSLDGDATFTGTAIVTVEDHHKTTDTDVRKTALYKDTTATLQYHELDSTHAQHTLTMNNLKATQGATANSDWYSMAVTGAEGNLNMNVTLSAAGKTIDSDFQFFSADNAGNITRNEADSIAAANQIVKTDGSANTINMFDGTTVDEHHRMNGSASAEYYGADAANPTEATAGVWMDERWASGDNNIQHEVAVYGAFGGQKDAE